MRNNRRPGPGCPFPEHRAQPAVLFVAAVALAGAVIGCGSARGPIGPAPAPPPRLGAIEIDPPSGPIGTVFTLIARGLNEGETVAFEITFPGEGKAYPGVAIPVPADGTVTTTYRATTANDPGEYIVRLTGVPGSLAEGRFIVGYGPARPGSEPTPAEARRPSPTTTKPSGATRPARPSTTATLIRRSTTTTVAKPSSTTATSRPTTTAPTGAATAPPAP